MLYFLTILYTIMLFVRPQEFVQQLRQMPLLQFVVLVGLPSLALLSVRGAAGAGGAKARLLGFGASQTPPTVLRFLPGIAVYGIVVASLLVLPATLPGDTPSGLAALAAAAPLQLALLAALGAWLGVRDKGWGLPQIQLFGPFLIVTSIGMGINGWWGGGLFLLQNVLPPILTAVLLSGAIRTLPQLRGYLVLLIGIASLIVLHGHLQVRDGIGWTGAGLANGRITYAGILDDPNDLGLLLVITVAAIIYLFSTTQSGALRTLQALTLGWLLYGVVLTNSRGTMLAIVTVFTFHLWRKYGKKTLIALGLMAVPLLLLGGRMVEIDAEEESAAGRIDAWIEGIGMLRSNPLFGVGYGNFTEYNNLTAHNTLVLAFSELGLLGYTLWMAIVGYSGYMLYWCTFRSQAWAAENGRSVPADFQSEIRAARGLLVAALGFAIGAFFLSQSFKALIFSMCGLAMGRYQHFARMIGPLPRLHFLRDLKYWVAASVGSIVFVYAFIKAAA